MLKAALRLLRPLSSIATVEAASQDSLLEAVSGEPGWNEAIRNAAGARVLIATSMACYNHARVVERSLAVALTLRNAQVNFLLCDRVLPVCQMTKIQNSDVEELLGRPDTVRCDGCMRDARALFDPLGLPVLRYGDFLEANQLERAQRLAAEIPLEEIPDYRSEDVSLGEHAYAGALRFYARGDLSGEPRGDAVLRRFFLSALLTKTCMETVLRKRRYDVAVFHHGIYTPQGIIGEVCRARGVRVVNWNPSYRRNTFIFSEGDTYHHTMISEPVEIWSSLRWKQALDQQTMQYLHSRRLGSGDWIWFHEAPKADMDSLADELGIDWSRPCVGLLTSVMWDAKLHYRANAFPDMLAWMRHTIDYFGQRPDLQLLIRIHPAEIRGMVPSRQKMADELKRMFPQMPANVFVIPPEHDASTYACMERCNSVLIFNTKMGIELACLGIPIVVAGEAWIRGKGFSLDASSPEQYTAILDRLPLQAGMASEQVDLAKKYAFHFFFRRMLELPFIVSPKKYKFEVELDYLRELGPGNHSGLDVICDGILLGAAFVDRFEEREPLSAAGS